MTGEETAKIMSVLAAAYPRMEVTKETMEVYARLLSDLPYEALKAAVLNYITRSQYFPTVAELRQAAIEVIPGNQLPAPGEAWGEVVVRIRDVGYYGQPKFSHPAIEKAVRAMGWRELCMSENPVADRAHFLRIYEAYRDREIQLALKVPEARELEARLTAQQQLPGERGKALSLLGRIGRTMGGEDDGQERSIRVCCSSDRTRRRSSGLGSGPETV